MTKFIKLLGFTTAFIVFIGGPAAQIALAQDQPVKRTELMRVDVTGVEGKEVVIYVADVAPGVVGGTHIHFGDEFVYVLDGVLLIDVEGQQEPITLQRGEAAHAPRDVVHAARNGSDSEPVKVLVHIVMDKGMPLAEAVD